MSRDWYIINTISRKEKNVVSALNNKKIITYYPLNNISPLNSSTLPLNRKSLFTSQLFIFISNDQIELVKQIPGVINFLYWLNEPAIIKREEIEAIQLITHQYNNIQLEKSTVNQFNGVSLNENNLFNTKGESPSKNIKTLTVILPTIGYTLRAEKEIAQPIMIEKEFQDAILPSKNINLLLQ